MISNIEITGSNYKPEETLKKYAIKRIGKLDKYLPRKLKKNATAKIIVKKIDHAHGDKYEISVAIDVPGGKIITARDECNNIYAGVDLVEAKLMGQIRRYKIDNNVVK